MGKRNYGIDLLRLFAMFLVIVLHVLGQGGILKNTAVGSGTYAAAWFLEILAYGAVDIFAVISGYVGYRDPVRKTRLSSYILLWLQVVSVGLAAALFFRLLRPDLVSRGDLALMLRPVSKRLYWYFTAYTGLFFVKPLLDRAVAACSETTARKVFLTIFLVFSCFNTLLSFDQDSLSFNLNGGYSFVWISLLYLLGAIMKKCGLGRRLSIPGGLLTILAVTALTWLSRLYWTEKLVAYTSPTVLCAAILAVAVFSRIPVGRRMEKLIAFAAPGAFSVYILNCQQQVWNLVMHNRFAFLAEKPAAVMLLSTLLFAFLFVAGAVLCDWVRQQLFRLLRLRELAEAAEKRFEAGLRLVAEKL